MLTLPRDAVEAQVLREWGYSDEATSLAGWAKPAVACDPAFRNIRAGLGGVPIRYRFSVPSGTAAQIVLGFCESHWAEAGQRPLDCRVEGASPKRSTRSPNGAGISPAGWSFRPGTPIETVGWTSPCAAQPGRRTSTRS